MPKDIIFTLIKNLKDFQSVNIKKKIDKIANLNVNILFYGETGVGKDFWANYLYRMSQYPVMLNLNCGDTPPNLLESEWFGYKKGAFTGAGQDYEGKWKKADNGILFLNQIDLLNPSLQSRLLRIIERKKYFPLGSNKEVDAKVRFVFSTDSDIEQKVKNGEFRKDLFYRISSYPIYISPLRERKKDILSLIRFFAHKNQMKLKLSKNASNILLNYEWRGNIRELENFVNSISVVKDIIDDQDVEALLKSSNDFIDTFKHSELSLADIEEAYIKFLLKKYKDKVKVAKILKIARKSLYNKLKRYEKD